MADYRFPEKIKVPRFEEEAGFYTTPERSELMAKIRSENTRPEIMLRKALWAVGLRFRVHNKKLPGRPDISNQRLKLAVFVDGEFWHGYQWQEKKQQIKSNRAFWIPKIERNMQRDEEVNWQLRQRGFTVFRFWEREVKKELGACVKRVLDYVEETLRYR
jgi:DNA mismatch endonuclease (patch repair protein)